MEHRLEQTDHLQEAMSDRWVVRGQPLVWGKRTYIMGVLNVTPDSFSDGGQFNTVESALHRAHEMVNSGADILDIGGQSTRPQSEAISIDAELQRVIPVIEAIRNGGLGYAPLSVPISIDTTQSVVANAAVNAGADIVNDISGATYDSNMLPTVATLGVPIILMHIRGTPKTMQQLTDYQDLVGEICDFLQQRAEAAIAHGISRSQIAIDPGIGFAKTYSQNLDLLRQANQFRALGYPVLIGPSRKSFIGHLLNQPDPQQRVWGTAAACCAAIAGCADLLRVHDVKEIQQVCLVADAIWRSA